MKPCAILILLLALTIPALAAPAQPSVGTYKFTKDHTVKVATKFAGGRGIDPNPVEWAERTYKPGETLKVDEFFWDDKTKTWSAKLVFHGTNLGVPMSKLKLVK
jgi:hypothetical protein